MTSTVAFAELTRVLPWSIRALGYPFGTAERAAHLVATAAALDPAVLDAVVSAGRRPASGFRYHRGRDGLRVEAGGCSLLEVGPVAIDYLAAHAGEAPPFTARIGGAMNPELIPAVLLIGAGYGLNCVAVRPQTEGGAWTAVEADPKDPRLWSGADRESLLAGFGRAELARSITSAEAHSDLVLLATPEPLGGTGDDAGTSTADAIATAHARGIPVSPRTLEALYALETITWAPSSERSRAQAGFTPKPAPAS